MIESREILSSCEKELLAWIRREATRFPFAKLTAQIQIEFQNRKPVMIRVTGPAEIEERFK